MGHPAQKPDDIDQDERLELHGTQPVPKEAARFEHSDAQRGLAVAGPFHRGSGSGGPGGWWIGTETEVAYPGWTFLHDLAGWRRERIPVKPSGRPVTVTPDWVCEILSSNRKTDTVTKFDVLGPFDAVELEVCVLFGDDPSV